MFEEIACERDCRFTESSQGTTCAYYPPVYDKNGVNTNPDMNISYYTVKCSTCGKSWSANSQNCKITYKEIEG